jgi:hypothetical protein
VAVGGLGQRLVGGALHGSGEALGSARSEEGLLAAVRGAWAVGLN